MTFHSVSDNQSPLFENCPDRSSNIFTYPNDENEAYYRLTLPLMAVRDNEPASQIEQSVIVRQQGEITFGAMDYDMDNF